MENTCNYSDKWQKYKNDYDKFEYDIILHDGTLVENCYPNAGKFNSISDEHDQQSFDENDVKEIRFSQRPRFGINYKVSSAQMDEDYSTRIENTLSSSNTYLYSNNNVPNDRYYYRKTSPIIKDPKIHRNEKCPCNSGQKYKNCCINN